MVKCLGKCIKIYISVLAMYYALLVIFFLPANAPEFEHVHFILHIEHCTLHTTCLYWILQMYCFTLQTSKTCLSWSQDLHGEMYLDLMN